MQLRPAPEPVAAEATVQKSKRAMTRAIHHGDKQVSTIVEVREALAAKQQKLHDIFAQAATDDPGVLDLKKVTVIAGGEAEKRLAIKRLNDEMSDLGAQLQTMTTGHALNAPATSYPFPGAGGSTRSDGAVDLGAAFVKSAAFTGMIKRGVGPQAELDLSPRDFLGSLEGKTVMSTTAGWAPQAIRSGVVVPSAMRPVQALDLFPASDTTQASVLFMEETTATNAAAEAAEAAAYAESTLAFTERTSPVAKIATSLPMTDEQIDDVEQAKSFVNSRLAFFIRQRLDGQVLTGNGTAPNLKGLLNVSGIQTQAKGADPGPDAIYKAIVKVMITGRAFPSGIVLHPTDWQNIRLLRTAEGVYIWGSPSEAGPATLWGIPVAQSDALTQGTGIVCDFLNFTTLAYRKGIEVQLGFVNDDFVKGKQTIRADVRVAMVVYRPAAICTITGL